VRILGRPSLASTFTFNKPNLTSESEHFKFHFAHKYITHLFVAVSDHYLVLAKLRERLAVNKKAAQKFEGERFNLKKINELEVKENNQIELTNGFAAFENLDVEEDVNRAWENIKENIKTQLRRA